MAVREDSQKMKSMRSVRLYTNQFKISLGKDLNVFFYEVSIMPEVIETFLFRDIIH